jgi:hypothetical protein
MKSRTVLNIKNVVKVDEATMRKETVPLCVKASTHRVHRFQMFTQGRWAGCTVFIQPPVEAIVDCFKDLSELLLH